MCKVAFSWGKSHSEVVLFLYTNWRTAIVQVFVTDRALMRSHQPSFQ
jgi:hypothetical protein